jgi:hypothetical protein
VEASAGVRDLNAGHSAVGCDKPRHTSERLDMRIRPDAQILWRDTPTRLDGGGFGDDQSGAAYCPRAQMDQVPVVRQAILGAVLAHRRDADPVTQRHAAQRQAIKQVGHVFK